MDKPAIPKERRRQLRLLKEIKCVYSVNFGKPEHGATANVAPNGIAVITRGKAQIGDMVAITFEGYGSHCGKVVRVFDEGFAVVLPVSSLDVL